MSRPAAGAIVLVDWRGGALPSEPTKMRPAVVVEDAALFPDAYPNVLVVPLTGDAMLAQKAFSERIEPSAQNGCSGVSWALGHHVTSASMRRIRMTPSRVTDVQLRAIRRRIALALGIVEI